MWKRFIYSRLGFLAVHLIAGVVALAMPLSEVAAQGTSDLAYRRWQYFFEPRAYPHDHIPHGAYQAARDEVERKWGAAAGTKSPAIGVGGWTSLGPSPTSEGHSGRITTIAVHPNDRTTIYIGAAQGGVWKTTDGGTSWTPLTDGQCSLAMGDIAIDPTNPNIVYAGTGEENFSGDSYYGCGVLRSADGGSSWTRLGASVFNGDTISKILIDPATAGTTTNTTLLVTSENGVYRSTDSGSSWTHVMVGTATDGVRNPSNSEIIYVGFLPEGPIYRGIYKSTNGGQSWSKLSNGLPTDNVGRISLAIAPSSPSVLYASIANISTGELLGIWKTVNAGASWSGLPASDASCGQQCWYDMVMAVDPGDSNTVHFGGFSLYLSTDGGSTFQDEGPDHPDQHAIAFQRGNILIPAAILVGNDGGIYRKPVGGSWQAINNNLTITQFYPGLALHPTNPSIALGGSQDNGVLYYSGSTIWKETLGGDGGFSAIDYNTPTIAYTEAEWIPGSFIGGPYYTDNLTNGIWSKFDYDIKADDYASFIPPLVMSPSDPQRLYFGTNRVYKTIGGVWRAVSDDLTNGGGYITTIAEAKSDPQVVYAGTSDGRVQISPDGGGTWVLVSNGLPDRHITHIAVNPTFPSNAFITVSGFDTGHVFKTVSRGVEWQDISGNLPNIPVNAIVLDPGAPSRNLMIGSDLGVFQTTDGGYTWTPINFGLPNVAVFDLVYNQNDGVLMAATHGRGVWQAVRPHTYYLTVWTEGLGGRVSSSPSGIDCGMGGTVCRAEFEPGAKVTLNASSVISTRRFANWRWACEGSSNCSITMDSDKSVAATFLLEPGSENAPPDTAVPPYLFLLPPLVLDSVLLSPLH
jgi:photosystem II stability/assembly factor-like uncharacterized protein